MQEITFATSNKGKVASMQRELERAGVKATIVQVPLELIEPQADTATEVAQAKARQAYAQLKRPVLVDDSSFHIAALGGFPGPYIKYMLSTIGIEGIMEFMDGRTDRSAYFLSSLVYIDEQGKEHVFSDSPYRGQITETIDEHDAEAAWSDLFKIFIPAGSDKTLARMTPDDHAKVNQHQVNAYEEFCLWVKNARS